VAIPEEHVMEFPNLMVNIAPTLDGDGFGFDVFSLPDRLTYMAREDAKEYTGTMACLWAIAAAVYLSLLGPRGMYEIGRTIVKKTRYARLLLAEVPGVGLPLSAAHFNQFVVAYDDAEMTVAEINDALLERGIFGGADLSQDFPCLGQSALYCVSELHTAEDLRRLAQTLKEILR
jgi:glycine dehydrogenase subunit 1